MIASDRKLTQITSGQRGGIHQHTHSNHRKTVGAAGTTSNAKNFPCSYLCLALSVGVILSSLLSQILFEKVQDSDSSCAHSQSGEGRWKYVLLERVGRGCRESQFLLPEAEEVEESVAGGIIWGQAATVIGICFVDIRSKCTKKAWVLYTGAWSIKFIPGNPCYLNPQRSFIKCH